jgi:[DsrC]-trisulfide reductase subunit O
MDIKRRDFIRVAGLGAAIGLTGGTIVEAAGKQVALHEPSTGTRWAMVIDVSKCIKDEGCKACSIACHKEHNVPELDKQHEIKWIWREHFDHALHEATHEHMPESIKHGTIPVLCNHCDNPPCVRVCPTQATWKREKDGLVMMDWHRCIGCRYCVAACPYGSRSFNYMDPRPHLDAIEETYPTRAQGVVEKCTFCDERLARGQEPACVEACAERGRALTFGDINDPKSAVRKVLEENFTIRRKPELGTSPQVYYIV